MISEDEIEFFGVFPNTSLETSRKTSFNVKRFKLENDVSPAPVSHWDEGDPAWKYTSLDFNADWDDPEWNRDTDSVHNLSMDGSFHSEETSLASETCAPSTSQSCDRYHPSVKINVVSPGKLLPTSPLRYCVTLPVQC